MTGVHKVMSSSWGREEIRSVHRSDVIMVPAR